ncbi:tRNA pseudouridine(55) synthase TruB [Anaerobacillus arseniciselenatis]|uniref:tRNA pseudouridine synthase B n=1 Tax=Anaerobacillus arseniciselenatis TaxID=85682 RepID=A0A1S2LBS4_9BACI|nr:tRNA pseudouridine(55) synthase TruB [Anaerobacillus arseniciselenatis]OIJ09948.1 tRNA pseudouridine(55) synthase TruB [Anaerobacillus arseniciselenatis]
MELQGILPLHKPKGMTSHDCVAKLRGILKTRKIGHTGTLDPEVTGVLPICIGKATKVAQYMSDYSKTYECEVTIGFSTTTEDFTGEIIDEKPVKELVTMKQLKEVVNSFVGEIEQIPPMYSAVKVNGKKLYEYARLGQVVERPSRRVVIHNLTILTEPELFDGNKLKFSFRVHCSKGTYVRTLAVDIGKQLGYPSHMSALVRTASGPFTLKECITFEQIESMFKAGDLQQKLFKLEDALSFLKHIEVNDTLAFKISNGAVLPFPEGIAENRFTVYNKNGECLAIYQKHPTKAGLMKPEKVF